MKGLKVAKLVKGLKVAIISFVEERDWEQLLFEEPSDGPRRRSSVDSDSHSCVANELGADRG